MHDEIDKRDHKIQKACSDKGRGIFQQLRVTSQSILASLPIYLANNHLTEEHVLKIHKPIILS